MGIELAIFDLDDTVIAADGSLVNNIDTLFNTLQEHAIRYAIVSNRPRMQGHIKLKRVGPGGSPFFGKEDFAARKGSPVFVSETCRSLQCNPDRTVYVGHSALDMRTAANAQTLFFNAIWADAETEYGIQVDEPICAPPSG